MTVIKTTATPAPAEVKETYKWLDLVDAMKKKDKPKLTEYKKILRLGVKAHSRKKARKSKPAKPNEWQNFCHTWKKAHPESSWKEVMQNAKVEYWKLKK